MNNISRLAIAATVVVALAGCTKKVKEIPSSSDGGPADTTSGAVTDALPDSSMPGRYSPSDLDSDSCLRQRVIYFEFDQDTLRPEFQATIACHAKYLRDRPEARMNMEGNADERGTREYNLGLGERRGNAVAAAIGSPGQVTVISYGEERPTCADSGEECWSRNRRVEIVYTAK